MEQIKFDYKKSFNWVREHPLIFLLLIPIILSIGFRAIPIFLPITDEWGQATFDEQLKSNIAKGIDQNYPQLPQFQKDKIINKEINKIYQEHSQEIKQQIKSISQNFKNQLQDQNGHTYLLALDPYLWFGYSKKYIETGQFGTGYNVDGKDYNFNRNGRIGAQTGLPFNSVVTIILYKIINIFKDYSVMATAFLVPLIITTLSIIPLFFIVRRLVGNLGAFFASCMYALHPALLTRTVAGFSDTDPYTVFFPLVCIWLLFEGLSNQVKWKQFSLISLCGACLVLFSIAWGQGSWMILDILIAGIFFYIFILILMNIKNKENWFNKDVKHLIYLFITFILSFVIGRGILSIIYFKDNILIGFKTIFNAIFLQPFWLLGFKDVAGSSIWPNVLTTVAELNTSSLSTVISTMGGTLLFIVSMIGICVLMYKSQKENILYKVFVILLNVWFIVTLFGATISLRFSALFVSVFSIMFGIALGLGFKYFQNFSDTLKINKMMLNVVILLVYLLLFLVPFTNAYVTVKHEVPTYNDAWHEILMEIKYDSKEGIITTWWDYGHFLTTMSGQHVTFDGGDQGNRIHWVGKILLTDNENEALAILRMLNCGSENSYNLIYNEMQDEYESKLLLDKIIMQTKTEARNTLKESNIININEVLNNTHCDNLLTQYFIASQDMIGKSGVWSHFGSWNFKRAQLYNKANKLNHNDGVKYIEEFMNLSHADAVDMYYEIQHKSGDEWIAPWLSYLSGIEKCKQKENMLFCSNNLIINLTDHNAYIRTLEGNININSLVYQQNGTLIEKKLGNEEIYSVALLEDNKVIFMHPQLAMSVFTKLYFYNGVGLNNFEMMTDITSFNGQRIVSWRVDLKNN